MDVPHLSNCFMCGTWFFHGSDGSEVTSPRDRAPREQATEAASPRQPAPKTPTPKMATTREQSLHQRKFPDGRTCVSCFSPGTSLLLAVPCGHVFCEPCISKRCSLALKDRTLVPAHCCGLEFPTEYVKEALGSVDFMTYTRFLRERQWKGTTLRSDVEYVRVVKRIGGMQCPRCGVGVQKISGCQTMRCFCGNQFLYKY